MSEEYGRKTNKIFNPSSTINNVINGQKKEKFLSIVFALPCILFTAIFIAYPVIYSFFLSFTNYDGIKKFNFIGLGNYYELFTSSDFLSVMENNIYFFVIGVPLSVIIPLLIAVLLYEEIPGFKFFKTVYLLPSVLSVIIVGILFREIFAYRGLINYVLNSSGLGILAINWLASGKTSIPIINVVMVWASFGTNVIILLASMAAIDPSVFESVLLDGANWFQKVFYITIPMIKEVIEFVCVMSVINVFSYMFGYIFSMTSGGPGYESSTIEYFMYMKGFRFNEIGNACAISTVLLIIVLVITKFLMNFFSKEE